MSYLKAITKLCLWLSILSILGGTLVCASVYIYLSPKLPSVEVLKQVKLQTPLRIYSQDNKLIGEFGEKRRTPILYEEVPPLFIKAIYAAEDDRFMFHHGVDIKGLLRATSQLLRSGQIQTGGSTITMQVARNFFLSRNQTFMRKFSEILLALQIERELSKQEILSLYINKIYLGNRAYGIEAAADVYYGKRIQDLNLAQLAMIAGLPKAPSTFNPIVNPSRALIRRNWILKRMLDLEYIDQETYDQAVNEPLTEKYHGLTLEVHAPYIAEMVRQEAMQLYGNSAYTDGYKIYTTVDGRLQEKAQAAIQEGLRGYDLRHGYRGPEKKLPLLNGNDFNEWLKILKNTPEYANQLPAGVTDVDNEQIEAVLSGGEKISIAWENGLKQARPYLSADAMGQLPSSPRDVVHVGDLIRVIKIQEKWHFTQVPDAQAALVALSPTDGAIKALVGGYDFRQSKFNRATQAKRQPGSNFKPFIYSAALENGFTAASVINDAPIVFEDNNVDSWRPENDSGKFFGPTRLRNALTHSRNLVSIRLLRVLGVAKAIKYVERFGFDTSNWTEDLSLALGTHELTPMEIVRGYAMLANGGYRIEPYVITSVHNVYNEEIYKANPLRVCENCAEVAEYDSEEDHNQDQPKEQTDSAMPRNAPPIMDKRVAYIMNDILKDVIKFGTGRSALDLKRSDIAGKTGTTNGPKDAWFSGFNRDLAATTWVGFDQNTVLGKREFGGSAALPIWKDFMRIAIGELPEHSLSQPDGIVSIKIDPTSGERASPGQENAIFEIFRKETVPAEIEAMPGTSTSMPSSGGEGLPEDLF